MMGWYKYEPTNNLLYPVIFEVHYEQKNYYNIF